MKRLPNLEIFVAGCLLEHIENWLAAVVGPLLESAEPIGTGMLLTSAVGPIILTPDIGKDSFTSIYFTTPDLPWPTDVDCARQAARELGVTVRCDPGEHFPEVDPLSDLFLEISSAGEERIILWNASD
jgi:hypothetical protein